MIILSIYLILVNLAILSVNRFKILIGFLCLQAIIICLIGSFDHFSWGSFSVIFLVKVVALPSLLLFLINKTKVTSDQSSYWGSLQNLLAIVVIGLLSFLLAYKLGNDFNLFPFVFTIMTGLTLIITYKTVLSQFIGFLIIQNGIFGIISILIAPVLLSTEIIIAFDLLLTSLAIFFAITLINLEFKNIEVKSLTTLKG